MVWNLNGNKEHAVLVVERIPLVDGLGIGRRHVDWLL
jgi:hypothetical protein